VKLKPHFEKIDNNIWAARDAAFFGWAMRIVRAKGKFHIDTYSGGLIGNWKTVARGFKTYGKAVSRAEAIGIPV